MREEMLRFGLAPERIVIVRNAVDTEAFACPDRRYDRADRWLYVGRLAPEKNLPALLDVLALPENRAATLTLVGDGPEAGLLKRRAADLGITPRVAFTGLVDNPAPLYCRHDLFILPSRAEGMPTALLEAMAAGLPCVCTPVGGTVDIMESGSVGVLAGDCSVAEIAAAVRRAASASREQRATWGRNARDLVRSRYHVERVAGIFEHLYTARDPTTPPRE